MKFWWKIGLKEVKNVLQKLTLSNVLFINFTAEEKRLLVKGFTFDQTFNEQKL